MELVWPQRSRECVLRVFQACTIDGKTGFSSIGFVNQHPAPGPGWRRYMEAERRDLESRRTGLLARLLGRPLPGESAEEVKRIAEEDRHRAQEGLVELRRGDKVWWKHIDELTSEDRSARVEAETARATWLRERLRRARGPGDS